MAKSESGESKKIEITEDQLAAAIRAAGEAGARAALEAHALVQPAAPRQMGSDEAWAAEISERKGLQKPPIEFKDFKCKSAETGSTFTARIVRGVVTQLNDYEFPDGIDRHEDDSPPGLVPHGKEIKAANGQETPDYQQWRWTEFWQADLRKYVGRKLPDHVRVDARVVVPAEAAE